WPCALACSPRSAIPPTSKRIRRRSCRLALLPILPGSNLWNKTPLSRSVCVGLDFAWST
ncbi:hypothetical protein BGX30_007253, partial [Mortierella sp. GBA39]